MNSIYPLFITHSFIHHSSVSGYDQLAMRWPQPRHTLSLHWPKSNYGEVHSQAGRLLSSLLLTAVNTFNLYRVLKCSTPKIDLIHVLYGEVDLPLPLQGAGHLPVVATFHQPPSHLTRSSRRLAHLREQLAHVSLVLVLCKEQEDFFRGLMEPRRVRIVPHGVDTAFFRPGSESRQRNILIVGGWLRDWHSSIHILSELIKIDPSVKVRIVNPSPDNPLLGAISRNQLQVTGRLSDDELLHEYQTCGVVFFPLRAATANNALLEASACGCRIVATDTGGVSEYVAQSARLFAPNADVRTIALLLLEELDRAQSVVTDAEAVEHSTGYDWSIVTARMHQLYHEAAMARLLQVN